MFDQFHLQLAVTIWSSIIGNLEFCIADDLAIRYSGNFPEIQAYPRKQIVEPSLSRKLNYKNAPLDQSSLYEESTTAEKLIFEQAELAELADRSPTLDAIYFRQTAATRDNARNDTSTIEHFVTDESQFFEDSDNFGQKIRIFIPEVRSTSLPSVEKYESSSVSSQRVNEIDKKENETRATKIPVRKNVSKSWQLAANTDLPKNNASNASRIRDRAENTIANGLNERASGKGGLNLDEKRIDDIDETVNSERLDFTSESDDNLSTSSSHTSSQGKLSGPIIVPDFLHFKKSNPIGESTDANRTEASSSTSIENKSAAGENSEIQDVIRSTLILNPLRVGVALVNAKENTLIDDDNEGSQSVRCIVTSSTAQTEANTLDEEGATNNDESSAKACSNTATDYERFSKQSEGALAEEDSSKKKPSEDVVEIQKSIEIYHSAPVQEIHYPVELAPPIRHIENNVYRRSKINDAIGVENLQKEDQLAGVISQSRKPILIDTSEGGYKKNLNFPYVSMGLYLSSDKRVEADGLNSFPPQQSSIGNNLGIPILLLPGQTQDATSYGQYTDPGNIFNGITMVAGANKHQTPNTFKSDKESHYVINTQEERPGTSQYHPFQRIAQNNQFPLIETRYILPISPPYSVLPKKSNEKPGYGSHTTEIESMDNKLSYQVEKLVDKQPVQQLTVNTPIPYEKQTTDKQARLQDAYPFYFEKSGEKKAPHAIHRFIMQPYPVHVRIPSVSAEKIVPDHLEKVVKHTRKSHPIEAGKNTENVKPHSEEIDKLFHPSSQVHRSLQKFYAEVASIPFHGNYVNSSSIHDYVRKKPSFYFEENTTGYNNKNGYFNYFEQSSNPVPPKEQLAPLGNLRGYRRRARLLEKDRTPKNKYMDIVDPRQASSNSFRMQLKSSPFFLIEARQQNLPGISKNARQSEGYPLGDIGNFRQSKVEYGFKPPMIPSIQYDEQTASKVDK
ncbi:hypothetical protein KPH14_005717 [Odynerus spinipes]|uniref:Uncharacterized protein n=1 Tax=Odynerus spinipes TaxID=1348599 RepID=A0AAD9RB34_9HYME|nr:hypothetical protein KPH14_005717 [Odynerus spinipes]